LQQRLGFDDFFPSSHTVRVIKYFINSIIVNEYFTGRRNRMLQPINSFFRIISMFEKQEQETRTHLDE
jgi:hypothetical protein